MNLLEGQCASSEIERNEAANRKKEMKGERMGDEERTGKRERVKE